MKRSVWRIWPSGYRGEGTEELDKEIRLKTTSPGAMSGAASGSGRTCTHTDKVASR